MASLPNAVTQFRRLISDPAGQGNLLTCYYFNCSLVVIKCQLLLKIFLISYDTT